MLQYTKETKQLRPKVDERSSAWVRFPNGKEYLLPVVMRRQKLVPVFYEDGSIGMQVQRLDDAIAPLVDAFFEIVSTVEGNLITLTAQAYSTFMSLVKALIQTHYEMPDTDLVHLLTLTNDQMAKLFEVILEHLRRQ